MSAAGILSFENVIARLTTLLDSTEPQIVSMILCERFPPSVPLTPEQQAVLLAFQKDLCVSEIRKSVPKIDYLLSRSWYVRNLALQEKMLCVVRRGLGPRVFVAAGDFEPHLNELLEQQERDFGIMRSLVSNFEYLEGRGWFMRNIQLQDKLFKIVSRGLGKNVDAVAGDFPEHLDKLLHDQEYKFKLMRSVVPNFSYLEERGWFMRDLELQNKLYKVVCGGRGERVSVFADNFHSHVSRLYTGL